MAKRKPKRSLETKEDFARVLMIPIEDIEKLSEKALIHLMASTVFFQRKAGGKWIDAQGITEWEKKHPEAIAWLASKGFTVEQAIASWQQELERRNARCRNAEFIGSGPLRTGNTPEVKIYRTRPDVFDLMSGNVSVEEWQNRGVKSAKPSPADVQPEKPSGWRSIAELCKVFSIPDDKRQAFRKAIERAHNKRLLLDAIQQIENPKPNDPRRLYDSGNEYIQSIAKKYHQ